MENSIKLSEVIGPGKRWLEYLKKIFSTTLEKLTGATLPPSPKAEITPLHQNRKTELFLFQYRSLMSTSKDRTEPVKGFHGAMVKTMSAALKTPHFGIVMRLTLLNWLRYKNETHCFCSWN